MTEEVTTEVQEENPTLTDSGSTALPNMDEIVAAKVAEAMAAMAAAQEQAPTPEAQPAPTVEQKAPEGVSEMELLKQEIEQLKSITVAKRQDEQDNVRYAAVGNGDVETGKLQWQAIQEFASDPRNVPSQEFNTFKKMLGGSDMEVQMAASALKQRYESSDVFESLQSEIHGSVVVKGRKMERVSSIELGQAMHDLQNNKISQAEYTLIRERRMKTTELEQRGL